MSIEHEAEKLAQWLEANPGTLPPEGLDPEVIEAVYALRPDLAPAPTIDLNDIFDTVQAQQAVEDAEEPEQLAEVIQLAPLRTQEEAKSNRRNGDGRPRPQPAVQDTSPPINISPKFLLGTVGSVALLAAAAALFILVPALQGGLLDQRNTEQLVRATEEAPTRSRSAADPQMDAPADRLEDEEDEGNADFGAPDSSPVANTAPTVSRPAPPKTKDTVVAATPPKESAKLETNEIQDLGALSDGITTRGGGSASTSAPPATSRMAAAMEESEAPALEPQETMATLEKSSTVGVAESKRRNRGAAKRSYDSDDEISSGLPDWSTQNPPYPNDWSAPPLSASERAIFDRAKDYAQKQSYATAAKTLIDSVHRVRSQTGQYFSATASGYYLQANQTKEAIKAASRCVNLSAQNTPLLSSCFCALGDAYKAAGDLKKAESAYEKAARYNRKR